jgi:hypothetical protein
LPWALVDFRYRFNDLETRISVSTPDSNSQMDRTASLWGRVSPVLIHRVSTAPKRGRFCVAGTQRPEISFLQSIPETPLLPPHAPSPQSALYSMSPGGDGSIAIPGSMPPKEPAPLIALRPEQAVVPRIGLLIPPPVSLAAAANGSATNGPSVPATLAAAKDWRGWSGRLRGC